MGEGSLDESKREIFGTDGLASAEEGLRDLSKFVCFSQKQLKIKVESLLKMHFKPQGSSAVDELHKLTD